MNLIEKTGWMRISALLLMMTMLPACTSLEERKASFDNGLNIFVGRNADDLVIAKGPPTSSYTLSTGAKVLEFARRETVMLGGNSVTELQAVYVPNPGGGGSVVQVPVHTNLPYSSFVLTCRILFTVSAANIVESWSARGNDCY